MANSDTPFGLRPVKKLDGSPYNAATVLCFWAGDTSNTLYPGDPVKLSGTADDNGVPAVDRAAVAGPSWGVMVSVAGDSNEDLTRDTPRYLSTSAGYLNVCKADNIVFELQEDSVGGALAKTDVGKKANFTFGTPSTSHPIQSAAELDSNTAVATTTGAAVQIIGFPVRPDNEIGTNAKWLVQLRIQTAAVA